MPAVSQKEEELAYLTSFLGAIRQQGEAIPIPDGAGPDFVVRAPELDIGIEVTEFHRVTRSAGIGRRQVEGIRDQVLAGARARWEASGLSFVEVHVHFDNQTPTKPQIRALAEQLTKCVEENLPP